MHIYAAGNVVVPAYLAILAKGYNVEMTGPDRWLLATKDGNSYHAEDPIFLLGLIMVGELRGENWQASDQEIDDFLVRFEGQQPEVPRTDSKP